MALGLMLQETGERVAAEILFRWGLQLNPADNQGFRFLVEDLRQVKA